MVTSQQILAANIIGVLLMFGALAWAVVKILTSKKKRKAIPAWLREEVMQRCNYKCWTCDLKKCLEIHHLDGDATNNKIGNLLVLCSDCHKKIPKKYKRK